MDHNAKLLIFQAQVENVRCLDSSIKQIRRTINSAIRRGDSASTIAHTKMYALMFCGWSEAFFSKILHTPHGFSLEEIEQVNTAKELGISAAWKKCVSLGLRHIDPKRGSFKPNAQQKLSNIIDTYVFDPSVLRNKLAHGQWATALNRPNTSLNTELTHEIQRLNIVTIDGWRTGHTILAESVEHLIESPKKAFIVNWYEFVETVEKQVKEAANRTLDEHIKRLSKGRIAKSI